MNRFTGSIIMDRNVDRAVMVTDSARSALNMLHHLLYDVYDVY